MAEVSCPQCGHPNPLGAKFCSSCGVAIGSGEPHTTMSVTVPVDSTMEEVEIELDELPPGIGMLVVTRGPNSGSKYALDEPLVTAGRHPDSIIFLDDITVSRRHAEVRQVEGGYEVKDVGSLNGTYLNRERVETARLTDGDELQIGTFKLLFLAGPAVTSAMADRSHLSIGEVLSLLQDDFPDVTISKIRFLESQGLLDPERTPSGYRKFYEGDIERLRWILRHQRDHFLPLKVMKDRLEEAAAAGLVVPPDEPPATTPVATPSLFEDARAEAAIAAAETADEEPDPPDPPADVEPPTPAPPPAAPSPSARGARPAPTMPELPVRPPVNPLDTGPTGVSFTLVELADASGLTVAELEELIRFGLLVGHSVAGDTFYDGDALIVARTAAGFVRFGIEARHLRMYKVAAEREAGFMEQVVMPLLKQRNPSARQQAADNLGELAGLGEQLRSALLRSALRDHTDLR